MDASAAQQLAALFERAQAGDRRAYQEFLLRARAIVTSTLRSRVRSAAELDDLVQETLLSIHRYRHTYDPRRPIGPWIHTIAMNRFRDGVRARRRQPQLDGFEHEPATQQGATEQAGPSLLAAAFGALSAAQREIIWLLKFEGYKVSEIAEKTGRSPSAVKVTAHRGYRALRAMLETR